MGVERLERRVNLAGGLLVPAVAAPLDDGTPAAVLASVAVPGPGQIAGLTASSPAVAANVAARNRVWSAAVEVAVPALPAGAELRLRVTDGLSFWNGRQAAAFTPARANVEVSLALGTESVSVRTGQARPGGPRELALAADAINRITATIRVDGRPGAAAAAGWYAVPARVVAPNGGPSTPITLLVSIGSVPAGSRAAAIRAVGGVGTTSAAVTVGVTLAQPPAAAPLPVVAASLSPTVVVPPPASQAPPQQPAASAVVPSAVDGIHEVSGDITVDTTFRAGTVYVITAEVHVRRGVTLTIEDGVEVRIRNGRGRWRLLTARALIFDAGSSLRARNVVFRAANDANEPVNVADNGGVFFCGGTRTATKDNVSSLDLRRQKIDWSFVADSITTHYLGRTDPAGGDGDGNLRDDIDAVSVIGAVFQEWKIKAVTSNHSGDDGFDLMNSSIAMETVRVFDPVEDGVNLTTSLLQIGNRLEIDMTDSLAPDREIFDFEVDTGPAQITIAPGADVNIRGYWDNSPGRQRIDVKSPDMPRPSLRTRAWYSFDGRLLQGNALIFAIP